MTKKILRALLLVAVLIGAGTPGAAAQDVETVNVGVGNVYPPFTYIDEEGNNAGYDFEVLKLVDEKLEQYEFTYEALEFRTILPALDAGQVRLTAHQWAKNEDREANYLFTEEPYWVVENFLVTSADSDFKPLTLDDLVGKTVVVSSGNNYGPIIDEYNATHEEQIELKYVEATFDLIVNELATGNADATILDSSFYYGLSDEIQEALDLAEEPFSTTDVFFIVSQGDAELKTAVDEAVAELREEGKLDELKEEFIINQ